MADKDVLGRAGEDRAAAHLSALGYTILDRNWRSPQGELDLVVARDRELVVVEVKTRRGLGYGHPFEAIDRRKQARLWRLAYGWMRAHPAEARGRAVQLDLIAIVGADPATGELEHLRDVR